MKKCALLCFILFLLFQSHTLVNAKEPVIDSVTITNIPSIEPGMSVSDAKPTFSLPKGCAANYCWFKWTINPKNGYLNYVKVTESTFDKNNVYSLRISFKATDGYVLSEDWLDVKFPAGIEADEIYQDEDKSNKLIYYCRMPDITFATPITRAEFTIPEVKAGNMAQISEINLYSGDELLPNDACHIKEKWYCMTQEEKDVTGQLFEEAQAYSFELDIYAENGYYFIEDAEAVFHGDDADYYSNPKALYVSADYTLVPEINCIELSGLPDAKAGEFMTPKLSLLSDLSDCEIYVDWSTEDFDEATSQTMKANSTYIVFISAEMYNYAPFSNDFVFLIDNVSYTPQELDTEYGMAFLALKYDLLAGTISYFPIEDILGGSGPEESENIEDSGEIENPNDIDGSNDIENISNTKDSPEEKSKDNDISKTESSIPDSNTPDNTNVSHAPETKDSAAVFFSITLLFLSLNLIIFLKKKI